MRQACRQYGYRVGYDTILAERPDVNTQSRNSAVPAVGSAIHFMRVSGVIEWNSTYRPVILMKILPKKHAFFT